MAVKFGGRTRPLLVILAVAQAGLLAATGWSTGMSFVYYAGAVLGTAITLGGYDSDNGLGETRKLLVVVPE